MKIKSQFIALLLLSQCFVGSAWADRAAVVVIDQITFGSNKQKIETFLPKIRAFLGGLGDWGLVLDGAIALAESYEKAGTPVSFEQIWDEARRNFIQSLNEKTKRYDRIYFVLGAKARDKAELDSVLSNAFLNHDLVDYFAFVHGGHQNIRGDLSLATIAARKNLGVVYSEACKGGHGSAHFIEGLGALASAGHGASDTPDSASPLYSFAFMRSWLGGDNFAVALAKAQAAGDALIDSSLGFMIAQNFGSFSNQADSKKGSKIDFRVRKGVDPTTLVLKAAASVPQICSLCTFQNKPAATRCEICTNPLNAIASAIVSAVKREKAEEKGGRWSCSTCTYENSASAGQCEICGSRKP